MTGPRRTPQREAIWLLLKNHTSRQVTELLAQPPPVGLNLKLGNSSYNRFRERYEKDLNEKNGLINIGLIERGYEGDARQTEIDLHKIIQRLIASRLLKRSADPNSTAREIHTLVSSLNTLRRDQRDELKVTLQLAEAIASPAKNFAETESTRPAPDSNSANEGAAILATRL